MDEWMARWKEREMGKESTCTPIVYIGNTFFSWFFWVEGMYAIWAQAREPLFEDGFYFYHVYHGDQTQVMNQVQWQESLQPELSLQLFFIYTDRKEVEFVRSRDLCVLLCFPTLTHG